MDPTLAVIALQLTIIIWQLSGIKGGRDDS
jgi:hypothetical protein